MHIYYVLYIILREVSRYVTGTVYEAGAEALAFLPPDPVAAGSGHEYVRTERLY